MEDEKSIFHYYQKLIALRRDDEVIKDGKYIDLLPKNPNIYAYMRKKDNKELIIVSNFTRIKRKNPLFNKLKSFELVLSNYDKNEDQLQPYETRMYKNY